MNKHNEEALAKVREIFGESTDPDVIAKFKEVEDALKASDNEYDELLEKHGKLATAYKSAVLGAGTTQPGDQVSETQRPKTFDEALDLEFRKAEEAHKK